MIIPWSKRVSAVVGQVHTYTLTRRADGATEIDVVLVRDGKNVKGHLLAFVFAVFGRRVLGTAFDNTVRAIEARNPPAVTTDQVEALGP